MLIFISEIVIVENNVTNEAGTNPTFKFLLKSPEKNVYGKKR
jgi:hypothetical protein